MTTKKRKSKRKSKRKTSKTTTRKRTDLEILKEKQSQLYSTVANNLDIILHQTQLTKEELGIVIEKYGYDAITKLDGFDVITPIWERMVKTFKVYDKVAGLVQRMEVAEGRLFITELEKKTVDMEAQLAKIEEEESFYSEKEKDKDGMTKMKEKWYAEKEHWEIKKAEILDKLTKEPENEALLAKLEEARRELGVLKSKRNKVRVQNIQPGIGKYTRKISNVIATVQDSIGEVTKPFAEAGGGFDKKSTGNNYDQMFTPEKIFGSKKGKKKDDDYGSFF